LLHPISLTNHDAPAFSHVEIALASHMLTSDTLNNRAAMINQWNVTLFCEFLDPPSVANLLAANKASTSNPNPTNPTNPFNLPLILRTPLNIRIIIYWPY
jgi:hypothetical protein